MQALKWAGLSREVRVHVGQEHRFAHIVRVARTADILAQRHGASPAKARLAGMLHDLARLYSGERLLAECARRGLSIDPFERANPVVLHARLGAEIARENFGVDDESVLSAIRKHTVADAEMTLLDCVVYLADALEPGRDFAERAAFFELACRDVEAGMRAVLHSTVAFLRARGLAVAPQTAAALERFSRAQSRTALCVSTEPD